jgi:hypothetical protein
MRTLATLLLVAVAVVNLLPGVGVLSASHLTSLYGIELEGADLVILMRHRAVLLAIVGGVLAASAFHRPLRPVAIAVGLASMLSFVAIALSVGAANAPLRRILAIDVVASGLLVAAAVLDRLVPPRSASG